jgi:hypothetical protein
MANALPGPAGETLQRPAVQHEPRIRRGLYRSVEAAMASCGYWDALVYRKREGRRVRERSGRAGHGHR